LGGVVKQWQWVGLSIGISVLPASSAAADGVLEFSLAEVEAATARTPGEAASAPAEAEAMPPEPPSASISGALGELRWGMNKADVLKLLKSRVQREFEERIKVERDIVRQDALYQDAKARFQRIREGFVTFDAHKNGWDTAPIADEFRRGTDESMLVVDDRAARDYYFFIRGQLWKWYRELKPEANAGDYDQVAELTRERFGAGRARRVQHGEGGASYEASSWTDASTRMTLIHRDSDTCLVFEASAVLEQLAELRKGALSGQQQSNHALDAVLLSDSQREAWRRGDPRVTDSGQRTHAVGH
jgi:hypothetical protein